MNFPIYEFSKAFPETQQSIDWVRKYYPEVFNYPELRQEIEEKGLWVSGRFSGEYFPMNRSNYPYVDSFPHEIVQAIKNSLFEIPNRDRPEPGVEALLKQGIKIEEPPLNSVALIAREIGDYCVLAVATGQIDNERRDRLVGYRCFWLDVRILRQEILEEPDGILTLLHWWLENGQPCFNMNPDSFKDTIHEGEKGLIYPRPKHLKLKEDEDSCLQQLPLKPEDKKDYPPFIISQDQDSIAVDFQDPKSIWLAVLKLHLLALSSQETFENCPVAWAWNVRRVTKPEEFGAIFCADEEAFAYYNERKSSLPPKKRKIKALSPASVDPKDTDDNDPDGGTNSQGDVSPKKTKEPSIANPDSLEITEEIKKIFKSHLDKFIRDPGSDQLKQLLGLYFNQVKNKIDQYCWNLLNEKNQNADFIQRQYTPYEVYEIYLLFIFSKPQNNQLTFPKFREAMPIFDQQGINITKFIQSLLFCFESLKKDQKFREYYRHYKADYKRLQARIELILNLKVQPPVGPSPLPSDRDLLDPLRNVLRPLYENLDNFVNKKNKRSNNQGTGKKTSSESGVKGEDRDNSEGQKSSNPPSTQNGQDCGEDSGGNPPTDDPWESRLMILFILVLLLGVGSLSYYYYRNFFHRIIDIEDSWAKEPIKYLEKDKALPLEKVNKQGFFCRIIDNCYQFRPDDPMNGKDYVSLLNKVAKTNSPPKIDSNKPVSRASALTVLGVYFGLPRIKDFIDFYQHIAGTYPLTSLSPEQKQKEIINHQNLCSLNGNASRAEIATMVYRVFVSHDKAKNITLQPQLSITDSLCYIQYLEASSNKDPEISTLKTKLSRMMDDKITPIRTLILPQNTPKEKEEARQIITKYYSFLDGLIPAKFTEQLPQLNLNTFQDQNETYNQHIKATLKEVNLYMPSDNPNEPYDLSVQQSIKNFQIDNMNMKKDDQNLGIVGPQTWTALAPVFKDAHRVVAYNYIKDNLESQEPLKKVLQHLKACQKKGALQYVDCVNTVNTQEGS